MACESWSPRSFLYFFQKTRKQKKNKKQIRKSRSELCHLKLCGCPFTKRETFFFFFFFCFWKQDVACVVPKSKGNSKPSFVFFCLSILFFVLIPPNPKFARFPLPFQNEILGSSKTKKTKNLMVVLSQQRNTPTSQQKRNGLPSRVEKMFLRNFGENLANISGKVCPFFPWHTDSSFLFFSLILCVNREQGTARWWGERCDKMFLCELYARLKSPSKIFKEEFSLFNLFLTNKKTLLNRL